jgi:hypothetical protein
MDVAPAQTVRRRQRGRIHCAQAELETGAPALDLAGGLIGSI